MINVRIDRDSATGRICSFAIAGHANYAESGRDIVCAGISAVTVGTVNAVEQLLGASMKSRMKDGFLQAEVSDPLAETAQAEKLQLLLESMVVMLETIEASYGSYMRISQSKRKRR